MAQSYDYIVVGGGTCGPIVAGRLSEDPSIKILIIEAGSHSEEVDDVQMPGAWTKCHSGKLDWNIVSTPQAGLNGKECRLPRGRFLGGSSGSNGTICIRGVKQDYDDWGFPEWNGDEMYRVMKKAEGFRPKKWFPHVEDAHGYDGPLVIEPAAAPFPLAHKMFESFQSKGLEYKPDMFSTGESANGCGHAMRSTWEGSRTTAADYIIKDMKRSNVTIECDRTVDKVLFEKNANGELEATGVEYVDNDGKRYTAKASREVLMAGGTYCTPAILMRSGIGPKAVLDELNIPVLLDLPGMGQNLQDHQLLFMYYELNTPDLTDDARVNHDPDAYANGHKEWKEKKSGWLSTFPFGAFAFARLSDRLEKESEEWRSFPRREGRDPMDLTPDQPNMEFFNTTCYGGPPEYTDKPKAGEWAFSMCGFLCGAMSRGEVKIKSLDPMEPPYVDPRYLSDRRDLLMMSEGIRFANEVVTQGAGTKDIVKGGWPHGANHHLYKTNEDWQPFVKKYASTSYHPGGTCKMGKEEDKMAVVDKYLRVYGCKNLRVVDCSMMPTLNSGHTQMPAFGIAEKAAEFIREQNHGAQKASTAVPATNGVKGANGVHATNGINGTNGHGVNSTSGYIKVQ